MSEDRVSYKPLVDAIGGLLSNPAVLEGLIAGASAIGASRKSKKEDDVLGGILSVLPQLLPLAALLMPMLSQTAASQPGLPEQSASASNGGVKVESEGEAVAANADGGEADAVDAVDAVDTAVEAMADAGGNDNGLLAGLMSGADDGGVSVSYESPQAQRENLLLALRPFLSESRRSAADAMVQVNKMSGALFGRREGGL